MREEPWSALLTLPPVDPSPNIANVLGEGKQIVGLMTQGGVSSSCHFTNVQSPQRSIVPRSDTALQLGLRAPDGGFRVDDAQLRVNETAILFEDEKVSHITFLVLVFGKRYCPLQRRQDLFANSLECGQCLDQLFACFGNLESNTLLQSDILSRSHFDLGICACDESLIAIEDWKFEADTRSGQNSISANFF